MSNSPNHHRDDELDLTLETIKQWETELERFTTDVLERISLFLPPDDVTDSEPFLPETETKTTDTDATTSADAP